MNTASQRTPLEHEANFIALGLLRFTLVRTNFCTDKNLRGSTLHSHGTGGTVLIFERLSVQIWDVKKAGQYFDQHRSIRIRENIRTVQGFARLARLQPGIYFYLCLLSKNVARSQFVSFVKCVPLCLKSNLTQNQLAKS